MIDLAEFSRGLKLHQGIWYGPGHQAVSYPPLGNRECFDLEAGSYWFAHRNRCLIAMMRRFPPGEFLVDIGAGNGFVSQGLTAAGISVCALEPGLDGAQAAVARGLPVVACATLEEADFYPGVLPAAGLFDVLEHIAEEHEFLRAVWRLLRPNGRLYLTVPALPALWSVEDEYAGHFRRYRLSALRRSLAATGFAVEWSSYLFAPLVPPVFLLRAVASRLGMRTVEAGRYRREHAVHGGAVASALSWMLQLELKRLTAGHTLPMGTSCQAVARRVE